MGTPAEQPVSDPGTVTGESPGTNPAWNDVLEVLPAQLHPLVTPHFQNWDKAANSRIEELNSKLTGYEPYAPLVEHGIGMDDVQKAILLMQEINTNPRAVFDALNEAYKYSQENTPPVADPNNPDPSATVNSQMQLPPEVQEQLNVLSQIVLQDQESKQAAQMDAALDKELNALAEKFPDVPLDKPTEDYVLGMMAIKNISAEQAMQQFVDLRSSLAPQPFAPKVLGGNGGGVPSQAIDPKTLSRNDTRNLVAQYLARNAQQG